MKRWSLRGGKLWEQPNGELVDYESHIAAMLDADRRAEDAEEEAAALAGQVTDLQEENALLRGTVEGVVSGDLLVQRRLPGYDMPFYWQYRADSWLSGGPCATAVEAAMEAERARREQK